MCLIALAYRVHPDVELAVAANRDELHARMTLGAQHLVDAPHVVAGCDLEAGGTWLGMTTHGRFAALTNRAGPRRQGLPSRGHLVAEFLKQKKAKITEYAFGIRGNEYAGFNLILYDGESLCYASNEYRDIKTLKPGIYAISNTALDADWPKMRVSAALLQRTLDAGCDKGMLFAGMRDASPITDATPDVSVSGNERPAPDSGQFASRVFVMGEEYGTRSTTLVFIRPQSLEYEERSYDPQGLPSMQRSFSLGKV